MLDRIIYWLQQPADFKGASDYILWGILIALLCIIIVVSIFKKRSNNNREYNQNDI